MFRCIDGSPRTRPIIRAAANDSVATAASTWGMPGYAKLQCSYIVFMGELRFVWDEAKAKSNLHKHGVSFEEARTVFSDEFARLIPDPDHSDEEDRFLLLGLGSKLRLLVVCHCYRYGEVIRIISARKASKPERQQYERYRHA